VQDAALSTAARIEIGQPRLFTLAAVLIVSAYGVLLAVPFFAAILVVSVMKLSVLTLLIPVLAIALAAVFLPLGLGNPYVSRLVRSLNPPSVPADARCAVQLAAVPRIRSGLRAILEDADDIGYLSFTSTGFEFQGDSVKLSVPYACIREVRPYNIGMRGLFVYGRRISVVVDGLPNVGALEFAERSSWLLPTSKRITRQLHKQFTKQ